ncbi:uncharacterized protein METZ01_LOCUS13293 [marine metagenome]|uniref:Uncharacterized protein n=1 Tax=marine metagenome TaxID=408172 RepID=A0A381P292_9ZZZZ
MPDGAEGGHCGLAAQRIVVAVGRFGRPGNDGEGTDRVVRPLRVFAGRPAGHLDHRPVAVS